MAAPKSSLNPYAPPYIPSHFYHRQTPPLLPPQTPSSIPTDPNFTQNSETPLDAQPQGPTTLPPPPFTAVTPTFPADSNELLHQPHEANLDEQVGNGESGHQIGNSDGGGGGDGGACSRGRENDDDDNNNSNKNGENHNIESDNRNDDHGLENHENLRIVESSYLPVRRNKPIMHLSYGEGNNINITTVMIRNVPNKFTRSKLLKLLDNHCMSMNEASKESGDENISAYDFLYLPMDFMTVENKGYAFVNFTNKEAVRKFYDAFHNKRWVFSLSHKIAEIVCAKIQGKEELVKHFENTLFICDNDEYLPLCFDPPRDGYGRPVKLQTLGRRSSISQFH